MATGSIEFAVAERVVVVDIIYDLLQHIHMYGLMVYTNRLYHLCHVLQEIELSDRRNTILHSL